jgi:hypothetical protein
MTNKERALVLLNRLIDFEIERIAMANLLRLNHACQEGKISHVSMESPRTLPGWCFSGERLVSDGGSPRNARKTSEL